MVETSFLFLTYNTALLLMLVFIFDLFVVRWRPGESSPYKVPVGIVVGIIGIIVIITHWTLENGAIFDTRSILLSLSGLFFGTIPTVIAMVMTGLFRYYQGGIGVTTGVLVIVATGSIGLLWRHRRKKDLEQYSFWDFYLFGIVVHIVMILLMLTFPWDIAKNVLLNITLPVMVIYPLGTALLGMMMTRHLQRDQLTEKIKKDETKLRIITDYTSDWDYWVGPDHLFIYCSRSCEHITGYTPADFESNPTLLETIVHPEDREIFRRHRTVADAQRHEQIDFRIIRRDGTIRWIGHSCVPVYNAEGEFLGTRGSNRDITAHKESEMKILTAKDEIAKLLDVTEQSRKVLLSVVEDQKIARERLAALNEELEERVSRRTMDLERANKELEAFSYSVSHDLRAPLRAINGFTKILHDEYRGTLNDDAKDLLSDIMKNTRNMSVLIDDLLELSRLSRKELTADMIDMERLFRQSFDELLQHDGRKNVRFDLNTIPPAYGDHTLIKQVIVNLLSNALKFTGKTNHPEITVAASSGDGMVTYSVADNGAGFDSTYANKLFGVFQRLHRADEFEGTGVGLAIVKRIVERHGGTVRGESMPDLGATFYFSISAHQ
ncbi:MAG: LytS/YhcK type 5TM receptor domain-containing protein [Bacteroidota bacterium]